MQHDLPSWWGDASWEMQSSWRMGTWDIMRVRGTQINVKPTQKEIFSHYRIKNVRLSIVREKIDVSTFPYKNKIHTTGISYGLDVLLFFWPALDLTWRQVKEFYSGREANVPWNLVDWATLQQSSGEGRSQEPCVPGQAIHLLLSFGQGTVPLFLHLSFVSLWGSAFEIGAIFSCGQP